MMENLLIDRRKFKRVKSEVDVIITIRMNDLENEYSIFSGKTINISATGISLKYDKNISMDTEIAITFFPQDSDELIDVKGKIRRVEKNGDLYNLAIEFVNVKQEFNTRLDQILNAMKSETEHPEPEPGPPSL